VPTAETAQQTSRRRSLGGENDGASRQLARYVKETGENGATAMEVRLVYRRDRFGRGGDQISFLERGWPAVRFSEPNEDFAHQHQDIRIQDGVQFGDLIEFVDFPYLARVTRVIGSSLGGALGIVWGLDPSDACLPRRRARKPRRFTSMGVGTH
jgi:hypothetical protein